MTDFAATCRPPFILGDPQTAAAVARVMNSNPAGTEYGLVVRLVGSLTLSPAVSVSASALPTNAAQEAGGNLAEIAANTAALGTAMSAKIVSASGALAALKASAGSLFGFSLQNNTASPVFLEFFNQASSGVTLGATTPSCVFVIPASGSLTVNSDIPLMAGAAAMSYACVTALGGATPASISGSIFYQ